MTNALIGLPVGATSLENAEQTFTFSGKDGTIPVFALFCGDEFVGRTVGLKEFYNTGGTLKCSLSAGKLSITQYTDVAGTTRHWALSACGKILKVSGLSIEIEITSSASSIASDANVLGFVLGTAEAYGGGSEALMVQVFVGSEATDGAGDGTKFVVYKREANTWSDVYSSGKLAVSNCWWKIEFSDNTWKVSLKKGTETTFLEVYSATDWFATSLLYPLFRNSDSSGVSVTFTSDYIKVTYPTFTIAYDQPDSDVNKGDVKVYDTKGQTDESLWQPVFNVDHPFEGDCIVENSIIRIKITKASTSQGLSFYGWDGSAYQHVGDMILFNRTANTWLTYWKFNKLEKITPEEAVFLAVNDNFNYRVSLLRGRSYIIFEGTEETGYQLGLQLQLAYSQKVAWTDGTIWGTMEGSKLDYTFSYNWIIGYDPDKPLLISLAFTQKPDGSAKYYRIYSSYQRLFQYKSSTVPSMRVYVIIIPFSGASNLFKQAEDATSVGGETNIVRDDFTDDSSASYTDLAGTMSFQTEGSASDSFTGDGTTKTFQLTYYPIVPDSQTVKVDGVTQTEDTDYSINDGTGELTFTTAPASGAVIEVTYTKRGCIIGVGTAGSAFEYINKLNSLKFGAGTYEADLCICNPNTTINQDADLVFGCQDADNFYMVAIGRRSTAPTNVLRLVKKVAGSWTILGEDSTVTVDYGTFYHVKVDWSPSTGALKVYWAGETSPRISVTDTTFDAGAVGARLRTESASGNVDLAFDNLVIIAEEVLSSGNKAVILDAGDNRIYYDLVAGTSIPFGRYLLVARVKDTANVASDLRLYLYDTYVGKDLFEELFTCTSNYAFYAIEVNIREAYESGHTMRFGVWKRKTTDNRIAVDYVFLVPLSNCLHFPMDIAHACMKDISVSKLKIKEK